jgi:hypothetical protein
VRVHRGGLAGAPVAQRVVDLLKGSLVVLAVHLEGDGRVFLQVNVVEADGAGIAVGGRVLQRFGAEQHDECGDAAAESGPDGLQ